MKSTADRFWVKVTKDGPIHHVLGTPCWDWRSSGHSGYGRFQFRVNGKTIYVYAHRYAWELTYGPVPEGKRVRHRCDRGSCVNPDHLVLGTQKDNVQDAIDRKRFNPSRGEWNPCSKLTDAQVIEIRERRAAGETLRALAEEFGCSEGNIMDIVRGLSWKHIGGPISPKKTMAEYKAKLDTSQIRELCRRYAAGESPSRLAEEFGVSHPHVHSLLRRNRIERRRVGQPAKLTPAQRRKIRKMYKPGKISMRAVAEQLGISEGLVFQAIHRQYLDDA